jgi:hypothetical protein
MNLGFIKIYRNDKAFAKVHWLLFKLFKIKRTIPCGRNKKYKYLCCELEPTEKNSYLVQEEYGFEVRCKCCDSVHISGSGHPETLAEALKFDWE